MQRLGNLLTIAALALPGCKRQDAASEELAQRVEKLEADVAKFRDIDKFVRPVMEQQKAEADRRAALEPDPAARFAVSVDGSPFIGPEGAAVTVIEAFDFA